jgi:monofunctional glycosyltransferase
MSDARPSADTAEVSPPADPGAAPGAVPDSPAAAGRRDSTGARLRGQLARIGPPTLALGRRLPGLATRAALGFVAVSVVLICTLRWVDPPASAFMVEHAIKSWYLGREPPHYYNDWVPWEQIPAAVPLAVIAAEDQRFPLHHGFDPVEIRKALTSWRGGGHLRGASTISQQTAKNLFLWPGRSWVRKGLEAWLAALIELLWPKQRILEVYLNIVQFSPSTYGIGAASLRYFHRPASELTLHEAALLAGVLPSPGAYRLERPSGRLRRRSAWIVDQTGRLGGERYLEGL